MNSDTIVLIGPMGSGKSAAGKRLAEMIGYTFLDTDALIEKTASATISEIFAREGEVGFRRREAKVLERVLAETGTVVACGGGAVTDPENIKVLRSGAFVVYLKVSAATAAARVGDGAGRPLLEGDNVAEKIAELIDERASLYESAASAIVDAEADVEEVVGRILETFPV
jgi:shikimate kinase